MMPGGQKILVVGAGPVGSLIFADLFLRFRSEKASGKIFWLVRSSKKRASLLTYGLIAKPAYESGGDEELEIDFRDNPIAEIIDWDDAAGKRFDAALIAVKAYSLFSALESIEAVSPGAHVLAVANGLVESDDFLLGVSFGGGAMTGTTLEYTLEPKIHFGISIYEKRANTKIRDFGKLQEVLSSFASDKGLIEWRRDENIHRTMLEKVAINSIVNPITAILDAQNEIMLYPPLLPLIYRLADEICDTLNAKYPAYKFDKENAVKNILEISKSTSVNFSSMLQDVRAGRENETAFLNAKIAEIAEKHGIKTPLNRWVLDMMTAVTRTPDSWFRVIP